MMRRLLIGTLLVLAACSRTPPPGQVSAVVEQAPPAPRRELVGKRPHDGYVYVPGYWNWVNARHVWVMGYWTPPPPGFHRYEAARWFHDRRQGWVLVRGRWH